MVRCTGDVLFGSFPSPSFVAGMEELAQWPTADLRYGTIVRAIVEEHAITHRAPNKPLTEIRCSTARDQDHGPHT
jgi:hypothetical protein